MKIKTLKVCKAGIIYAEITAPVVWWREIKAVTTYDATELPFILHFMHKDFTMDDFVRSNLDNVVAERIESLNELRRKFLAVKDNDENCISERLSIIRNAEYICPSTYIAYNRVTLTYDEISEIYSRRFDDPRDEWRTFFEWVKTLPDSEKIIFNKGE